MKPTSRSSGIQVCHVWSGLTVACAIHACPPVLNCIFFLTLGLLMLMQVSYMERPRSAYPVILGTYLFSAAANLVYCLTLQDLESIFLLAFPLLLLFLTFREVEATEALEATVRRSAIRNRVCLLTADPDTTRTVDL